MNEILNGLLIVFIFYVIMPTPLSPLWHVVCGWNWDCKFGFHNWKCVTKSKSISGVVKEYFNCTLCTKKKMIQYHVPECWKCCSEIVNGQCDCSKLGLDIR